MKNPKPKTQNQESLEQELKAAQELEKRAVADYQNLLRRQQQERLEIIKFATGELVADLIQPLDHLSLAAKQINDQGLNMVVIQLWEVLKNHGLEEINPNIGDKFDLESMEAIASSAEEELVIKNPKSKISQVVGKGYRLNSKIIRHAKVIVK